MKLRGMSQERFDQLRENPELRKTAGDELWEELWRAMTLIADANAMHYRLLSYSLPRESRGDRDPKAHEEWLDYLKRSGIVLREED